MGNRILVVSENMNVVSGYSNATYESFYDHGKRDSKKSLEFDSIVFVVTDKIIEDQIKKIKLAFNTKDIKVSINIRIKGENPAADLARIQQSSIDYRKILEGKKVNLLFDK